MAITCLTMLVCSITDHNDVASSVDPLPVTENLTCSPNTPMMLTTAAYSISLLHKKHRFSNALVGWAHIGVKVTVMLVDCRGWVIPLDGVTMKTPVQRDWPSLDSSVMEYCLTDSTIEVKLIKTSITPTGSLR